MIAAPRGGLDVLLVFEDLVDLPRLEQGVFALLGAASDAQGAVASSLSPLRIHLCLPRFSVAELRAVRDATRPIQDLCPEMAVRLHNWHLPEPHDLRVPLLNLGMERAEGRYLGCVEIGQLMSPGAYRRLHDRLVVTGHALAVGGVEEVPVAWWGDVILPARRRQSPKPDSLDSHHVAPAFLLDRWRISPSDLRLRAAWSGNPLRDLVTSISTSQPTDYALADARLCVQQILVANI
ncbi:hypothetical protein ACLF3G_10515 [Falsiroseomonas sp. HC035]|uniref:hypothetical protein n=1 Tax=Falsiroseomonas sp. HC035 TaxID=3390999 RepID=UPI003D321EDF